MLKAVPPPVKLPLFSAGVWPRLAVRNKVWQLKERTVKATFLWLCYRRGRQEPALAVAVMQSDLWKDI